MPKRQAGAVLKAWTIFSKTPKGKRKEMLEACARAGLNEHTAQTQYARWRNASPAERKSKLGSTKKKEAKKSSPAVAVQP